MAKSRDMRIPCEDLGDLKKKLPTLFPKAHYTAVCGGRVVLVRVMEVIEENGKKKTLDACQYHGKITQGDGYVDIPERSIDIVTEWNNV